MTKYVQTRLNVSLSKGVGEQLVVLQKKLADRLGFEPSMSQVIEHLFDAYNKTEVAEPSTGQTD
jgi:hypothetical protein